MGRMEVDRVDGIINVPEISGSKVRHPRGYLYRSRVGGCARDRVAQSGDSILCCSAGDAVGKSFSGFGYIGSDERPEQERGAVTHTG